MARGMVTATMVVVEHLIFRYPDAAAPVLRDLSFQLPAGARVLVLGRNGAGKSTLLRILAGKHLMPRGFVTILGRDAFHDTSLVNDISFVGGSFPFDVDMTVAEILRRRQLHGARLDALVRVLGVNLDWHMHRVSEGQRRRVQLLLNLVNPWQLLLLDEATADLDLLARLDLLAWLRQEGDSRKATLLYATHVLDRLEDWATHVMFLEQGQIHTFARLETLQELRQLREEGAGSPLNQLAERWLRQASLNHPSSSGDDR